LSAHYPADVHATLRLDNINNTAAYNEIQVHLIEMNKKVTAQLSNFTSHTHTNSIIREELY